VNEHIKELAFKAGFSLTAYEGLWEAENTDIERFYEMAFEAGRMVGFKQDKALTELARIGQEIERAHTDHPMQHWDRTCPACVEQEPQYKPVATIHIRYGTALVDCPCCANKLTITFTDPPRKEWVGMTSQEVDEIREQIFQEHTTALLNNKEINEENDYGAWNFYQRIESKLKDRNT